MFTLDGADDLGYPHQSPEQERVHGRSCMRIENEDKMPEDIHVEMLIENMSRQMQAVAFLRWRVGASYQMIAMRAGLRDLSGRPSVAKARSRVDSIRQRVADKVIL